MPSLNYNLEMEKQIKTLPKGMPLLLHACCAPCSSSVLERLAGHFSLTVFFYNPNIWPWEEYTRRKAELEKFLSLHPLKDSITYVCGPYDADAFEQAAQGLHREPEGGARCAACFRLRLQAAAREAAGRGIGLFTTTLTVSPHKNAGLLNELGNSIGQEHSIRFLPSDFKKKDGYKKSLVLSAQYGLYRQAYCGCRYSYEERKGRNTSQADSNLPNE